MPALLVLTLAALLLAFALVAWYGAEQMTRRRPPDPLVTPAEFGLPYREVQFAARDGATLGGYWLAPTVATDAAVLICPGYSGSLDPDVKYAVPLHRAGYGVLLFDFRAHGRSSGDWVTWGDQERADVLGAVDWLVAHGMRRVALLGFSMGAGAAISAAGDHPAVTAVIADGAFARPLTAVAGGLRERYRSGALTRPLAWAMLTVAAWRIGIHLAGATPLRHVARVTPRPLLLIHGARDIYVPMDDIRAVYRAASAPKTLWVIPEAGHRETDSCRPDEWRRRVLTFLGTHVPLQGKAWISDQGEATAPPTPREVSS